MLDDTLCPKWGRQIYGTATHFDHVRRPRPGFLWGHNWIVLAVVLRAGSKMSIALPFWIRLYRPNVAKSQMGLDSAEVRKERSVVRHATLCMALITWTAVWAYRRNPPSWTRPFAQKLASLRAETITSTVFASGPRTRGSGRIARGIADLFTHATSAA
ncbi:MAG: hypothetical protein AB1726_17580 [Planctomycetota bacterium]